MRTAPAVDAPLGDGGRERMLSALLYGLCGLMTSAWLMSRSEVDVGAWFWWLAGGIGAVAAFVGRAAWPMAPGRLRWTGQEWQLSDGVPLRRVAVQIDVGAWMLLRLSPLGGRPRWAAVSARQAGPDWHGLRVALQFHAGNAHAAIAAGTR
jgi:hypothetical protein